MSKYDTHIYSIVGIPDEQDGYKQVRSGNEIARNKA